ncbi:MAG: 3'-5' exonuclease [Sporomusaceae bacterium]|nr:3'-5' exonuclease [Sporomusaceae bacterium]
MRNNYRSERSRSVISRTFTAIDFETANQARNSACQLGIVVVENGGIVDSRSWLIKPPTPLFTFTYIHGISYEQVKDQPTFAELWPAIRPYLGGRLLAAHNAGFDIGVLQAVLGHYRLSAPPFRVLDSLTVARRTWPHLPNHRLNTVAGHLNFPFVHHDAAADARACAEILLRAAGETAAADTPGPQLFE